MRNRAKRVLAMKLLVIGATQGIGRATVDEALARDHAVRAMARSADDMEDRVGLERYSGDATSVEDMREALRDVDVVIQSLGIKESIAMLWQQVTLFSKATEVLLSLMSEHGLKRLIVVTGFGAGRSTSAMSSIERVGHRAILGKPYADKDRQEAMIEASDLDWTIVRPVILTNNAARDSVKILSDPSSWRNGLISRKSVARVLVDLAESGDFVRQDIVISH